MNLSRVKVPFVVLLLASVVSTIGCSRQEEGQRCSLANGDLDCEGNLVCTDHNKLRRGEDGVDRCCPEELGSTDTPECAQRTNSGNGNGDGDGDSTGDGDGGAGGMSGGDDGPPDLGSACDYTSECSEPLICGPSGKCQYECNGDRDCGDGEVCSDESTCVPG